MADKEQIKRHLALTTQLSMENLPKVKGENARKMRIMEHVKKSMG